VSSNNDLKRLVALGDPAVVKDEQKSRLAFCVLKIRGRVLLTISPNPGIHSVSLCVSLCQTSFSLTGNATVIGPYSHRSQVLNFLARSEALRTRIILRGRRLRTGVCHANRHSVFVELGGESGR
jgi:hypothetical protein